MILKELKIRNLGYIENFSREFSDGLNVIGCREGEELSFAIRLLFNHKILIPPRILTSAETELEAKMLVSDKTYRVVATFAGGQSPPAVFCYSIEGEDVTSEYLYLTRHPREHDLSDVFEGEESGTFLRFLKYANEDLYYAPRELSMLTDGMSDLSAFRAYLRNYIASFKPERIRAGKSYEIFLDKDGRYAVKCMIDGSKAKLMSESDKTLFRYLCFLRTAEFWRGFEELRNLHGIQKPLVVSQFLEKLDESIDVDHLLERTKNLNRQVIILTEA